jgi:hypothetical protein
MRLDPRPSWQAFNGTGIKLAYDDPVDLYDVEELGPLGTRPARSVHYT